MSASALVGDYAKDVFALRPRISVPKQDPSSVDPLDIVERFWSEKVAQGFPVDENLRLMYEYLKTGEVSSNLRAAIASQLDKDGDEWTLAAACLVKARRAVRNKWDPAFFPSENSTSWRQRRGMAALHTMRLVELFQEAGLGIRRLRMTHWHEPGRLSFNAFCTAIESARDMYQTVGLHLLARVQAGAAAETPVSSEQPLPDGCPALPPLPDLSNKQQADDFAAKYNATTAAWTAWLAQVCLVLCLAGRPCDAQPDLRRLTRSCACFVQEQQRIQAMDQSLCRQLECLRQVCSISRGLDVLLRP